jgi:hypothetical protein
MQLCSVKNSIEQSVQHMTANKNIMVGILLAEKALLKSPYVKRYFGLERWKLR